MKQGNVEADDCVKSHVSALPLSLLENISSCWQDSTQQAKALWAMANIKRGNVWVAPLSVKVQA